MFKASRGTQARCLQYLSSSMNRDGWHLYPNYCDDVTFITETTNEWKKLSWTAEVHGAALVCKEDGFAAFVPRDC